MKQRKEARKEKEGTRNPDAVGQSREGKKRKFDNGTGDDGGAGGDHRDGAKKAKGSVVISSLFRKNPEVPVISK